jgi:1-acyl-sn-glycerol-3-phosphate acyltransferase
MKESASSARIGLFGILYGVYAWTVFLICVVAAILFAVVVPGLERRRRLVTMCARLPFSLAGISIRVRGLEKLPDDCVVVANHASYLDGVLLQAVLPPQFSYVIKGEMEFTPVVGYLLRRIGSRFVERFKTSGSARDARQLLKAARSGESLAFFPEGTFVKEPGLGGFRGGAFAAAITAGVPLVPLVISGSRRILPAHSYLPRHGHLAIDILNPIDRSEPAYADHRTLADLARQRMLEVLNEPDLRPDTVD